MEKTSGCNSLIVPQFIDKVWGDVWLNGESGKSAVPDFV